MLAQWGGFCPPEWTCTHIHAQSDGLKSITYVWITLDNNNCLVEAFTWTFNSKIRQRVRSIPRWMLFISEKNTTYTNFCNYALSNQKQYLLFDKGVASRCYLSHRLIGSLFAFWCFLIRADLPSQNTPRYASFCNIDNRLKRFVQQFTTSWGCKKTEERSSLAGGYGPWTRFNYSI